MKAFSTTLNLFIVFLFLYIFFTPLFTAYDLLFLKQISIVSMLFFMFAYLVMDFLTVKHSYEYFVIFGVPILSIIYILIWKGNTEISLIIAILIGYVASKNSKVFIKLLVVIVSIQFCAVLYEYITNDYLFTKVALGFSGSEEATVTTEMYGDVGFRPKGIFIGTLEATSFIIATSLLFRKNIKFLLVLVLMAIMVNGRFCIIATSSILFFSVLGSFNRDKISFLIKPLLMLVPIAMVATFALLFTKYQSAEAIENMMAVFDFDSDSNSARIFYSFAGITEYMNYDLIHLLFGKSSFFAEKYEHSAESGLINELLIIGLVGASIYLFAIFSLAYCAIKNGDIFLAYTFFVIFVSILMYRYEAGYMRCVLLWFYIFYSYQNLLNIKHSKVLT